MTTEYNQSIDTTILEEIQSLITTNRQLETLARDHLDAVAVGLLGWHPKTQGDTRADVSSTEGILYTIHQDLLETNSQLSALTEYLYRLRRELLPAERVSVG